MSHWDTSKDNNGLLWGLMCALLVFSCFLLADLSYQVDLGFFDAHNFMLQARRLHDSSYDFVGFDSRRPRTLVAIITFFDLIVLGIKGSYPSLSQYHLLMSFVSMSFICIWAHIIRILFGKSVSAVAIIFLLIQQLFLHYGFTLLSDTVAGLFWGICFLSFHSFLTKTWNNKSLTRSSAIWLSFFGMLAALTKNHMLVLYPGLIILLFVGKKLWPNSIFPNLAKKQLRNWVLRTGFFFLLWIDIFTRVFGYSGEGIPEHIRHLIVQAIDARGETTYWSIYVKAIWDSYGAMFVVLSGAATVATVVSLFRNRWTPYIKTTRGFSVLCLTAVTLFYVGLTQYISHREVRYLIPFWPVMMVPIAIGLILLKKNLPKPMGFALFIVVVLACLHPVKRTWADISRYYQQPEYQAERFNMSKLPERLSSKNCSVIHSCRFGVTVKPFEFDHDPYYRQYDFEPQFEVWAATPAHAHACPMMSGPNELVQFGKTLNESSDPKACFLLRFIPEDKQESLVLLKRLAESEEAETVASNKHCLDGACYYYERFFFH